MWIQSKDKWSENNLTTPSSTFPSPCLYPSFSPETHPVVPLPSTRSSKFIFPSWLTPLQSIKGVLDMLIFHVTEVVFNFLHTVYAVSLQALGRQRVFDGYADNRASRYTWGYEMNSKQKLTDSSPGKCHIPEGLCGIYSSNIAVTPHISRTFGPYVKSIKATTTTKKNIKGLNLNAPLRSPLWPAGGPCYPSYSRRREP